MPKQIHTKSALKNFLSKLWHELSKRSVTRLSDLLDFGQLFKGFGNN